MSCSTVSTRVANPGPGARAAAGASVFNAKARRHAGGQPSNPAALPPFLGGRGAPAAGTPRFLANESALTGTSTVSPQPDLDATAQTAPSGQNSPSPIQRQCAGGSSSGGPGQCDECAAQEGLLQPKLSLSQPGDPFEQEADHAADAVISGAAVPTLSPLSSAASAVQAKGEGAEVSAGTATAAQAVSRGGRPLDAAERAYFEPRFGHDLSPVRVHTDSHAGQAARAINATAYTFNNHIAFAPGTYNPSTENGQRLMAHELAHTLQQGKGAVIRRTCPTGDAAGPKSAGLLFEVKVWQIHGLASYQKLADEDKQLTEHIIDGARGSACPMYYIDMLHTLFSTTEQDDAEQSAKGAAEIDTAKKSETARVAVEKKKVAEGKVKEDTTQVEEKIADAPGRVWTPRVGSGGKQFYVDARDANQIVVRIKVRLTAAGSGTAEDVKGITALQDGIEKAAATSGYTFDIVFVEASGPDVFEAGVDTAKWTTSGNWVGEVKTMAHEAHHLLGLEDRYNYIESHAGNAGMDIPDRLHWFREQMVRGPDPTSRRSMMNDHQAHQFDDLDVCAVAKEKSEVAGCVTDRIRGKGMDELLHLGRALASNYEPQNAAMLRQMAEAWQSQCFARYPEQYFWRALTIGDPAADKRWGTDCRKPPEDAFGKVDSFGAFWDELRYPLGNPHDQPEGTSLKREATPWWAPLP